MAKFDLVMSANTKFEHIVPPLEEPIRFNTYCERFLTVIPSRKGIKKAIARGELKLNGEKAHGGQWLKSGDCITLVDAEQKSPRPYHMSLDIVYEDEDMAVIVKPAGLTVSGNQFKTVQNALLHNITPAASQDALPWPQPVHRLDNQTSGLLLIAKTRAARIQFGHIFEQRKIQKKYHALVIGTTPESCTVDFPIEEKSSRSTLKKLATAPSLKNEVLTLVELTPITGRTHQLRIHCAESGYPILGDGLYGIPGMILKHKGLFLSAVSLEFNHPVTGVPLHFKMPTPAKFLTRMENEKRRFEQWQKSIQNTNNSVPPQ